PKRDDQRAGCFFLKHSSRDIDCTRQHERKHEAAARTYGQGFHEQHWGVAMPSDASLSGAEAERMEQIEDQPGRDGGEPQGKAQETSPLQNSDSKKERGSV